MPTLVRSLVAAALLLANPVAAKKAKKSAPVAPALFRCQVILSQATGDRAIFQAWGPDPVSAEGQGIRAARLLADQMLMVDLFRGMIWGDHDASAVAAALARLDQASGDDPFRVPGFSVEVGACQETTVAELQPGEAFEVTWAGGSRARVVRHSPAAAIEASRRRSCLLAAQPRVMQSLQSVGDVGLAGSVGSSRAWSELRAGMARCYSKPLAAPVPVPEPGPADPSGYQQCTVTEGQGHKAEVVVTAFGPGSDWAREATLQDATVARSRRYLGRAAHLVTGKAHPDVALKGLLGAARVAFTGVPSTDTDEQSRVSCTLRDNTAGGRLLWTTQDPKVIQACAQGDDWGDRSARFAGGDDLNRRRDELCQEETWAGVNDLVANQGPGDGSGGLRKALEGWSGVFSCEAACLSAVAPVGELADDAGGAMDPVDPD